MKPAKKEDWMNAKWRPAMGWMYMTVCIFDFIVFPIFFTVVQFWEVEAANDAFRQWQPLTLSGAGLFHMAMGAVLGISAWSRGQEKIQGVAGMQTISTMPMSQNSMMPSQQTSMVYKETTVDTVMPVQVGYKGKKAPPEPDYPTL